MPPPRRGDTMRKQSGAIGENALGECPHVMVGADRAIGLRYCQTGYDVLAGTRLGHERVRVPPAGHHIVTTAAAFKPVQPEAATQDIGIVGQARIGAYRIVRSTSRKGPVEKPSFRPCYSLWRMCF
jgi:hypothetical protein